MAQNITLLGASYPAVPAVLLPKTGGGTAQFDDTSDANATQSDILSGKTAYVNGQKLTGTGSGGGGGGWTKIGNTTELTVNTTSTSASSAGTISIGSAYYTKDKLVWVRVRDKSGKRAGYFYGSDAYFMNLYSANGATTTLNIPAVVCYRYNNSAYAATSGQYGVYGYSISSTGTLTIRRRYNSSYSLTINSTYLVDVYVIDPPANKPYFE